LGLPVPTDGDHALRNERMMLLISLAGTPLRLRPTSAAGAGRARSAPAKPSHSGPTVGASSTDCPVTASLNPVDIETENSRCVGKPRVRRFTWAPEKSPG
jgi:hypothetical protein